MANLFDTSAYPTAEPTTLQAGDRWMWRRPDLTADYPPASYALTYTARLDGTGATSIAITAGETSGEYVVEVASATTANYTAGTYRWSAYITRSSDSQRVEVGSGTWTVKANRASATTDPRSPVKVMLDKIDSLMLGRADADVASYSIAGRSIAKMTIEELRKWRDYYASLYASEMEEEKVSAGLGTGRKILTRF